MVFNHTKHCGKIPPPQYAITRSADTKEALLGAFFKTVGKRDGNIMAFANPRSAIHATDT
ncbi:hypothetical protein AA11825_1854 [Acetobacter pomorum DSM 11825]|nr:hypothetical protein AA11825_1854 [Acetobacter pomorum DSM 11825]